MQDQDAASAEAVHQTYERQVAETNAARVEDLWARIEAAVGTGAGRPRASRQERGLTVTDPTSGRTLRFVMDDVLDLPEDQRPGPFGMGNARVTMTAWDGTRRAWLLRNVTAGGIDYQWVTLPGDVAVGDEVIAALVAGLTSGEMPPDPAETAHMDATTAASATLATGDRWAIYNLYSGERRPDTFASGAEAGAALKDLVRSGQLGEGDWEVRPVETRDR